ncbi:AbrB/MazE/SpoVT family DNA-binding domain-containing protein [Aphanothece sacrum]|uniref:Antitoxin MazE n=1 Tax=Aphanothece sacrum FPU1 TaxID=1920663 RepID=A0A401IJ95_APHSA|nr:AbrB/MazE/SpoVT family DNA-binding domain-containing protein [Aphanothece sacrum]GBF81329.1 antitoxin MazE [Aphanothece sacrum FPU1]GBF86148.1 antitoxin MazE [Aphanothece sacrum FPU3]
MKSQIGKWGNSLGFRIPKHIVETLNLKPHDSVECFIENGRLIVERIDQLPEFSLEELLDQVSEPSEEEIDWGKPYGDEVW